MKRIVLIGLIVVSAAALAQAAVITVGPSDCSAATINAVISASTTHDGDTVLLTCTGSVTWSTPVQIPDTKGITLQVKGGTNTPKTSANLPLIVTVASSGQAVVATIAPNRAVTRISGFRFAPNQGTADGFIEVTGAGSGTTGVGGFRVDNNYFDTISCNYGCIAVWAGHSGTQGKLYGLIDNNTFHNSWRRSDTSYGPYNIMVWNYWHPASPSGNQCWGCDSWTSDDFAYGSAHFTFIEDNLFEQTADAPAHMRHYISAELGGKYVSRHNTFINNYPDQNADLHDAHGLCLVDSNGAGSRGGEIYANTIQGAGYDRAMQLRGGSWIIYDNVITAGGGNPIEFNEYRAETSSSCPSTTNLVLMPPWPVPAGAQWNANAAWIPYAPANGSAWPLPEQIFNSFAWNNLTPSRTLINPAVPSGTEEQTYIKNNRDYFAAATKPAGISSYTPYTYPHPLQSGGTGGGGGGAPATPSGLTAKVN